MCFCLAQSHGASMSKVESAIGVLSFRARAMLEGLVLSTQKVKVPGFPFYITTIFFMITVVIVLVFIVATITVMITTIIILIISITIANCYCYHYQHCYHHHYFYGLIGLEDRFWGLDSLTMRYLNTLGSVHVLCSYLETASPAVGHEALLLVRPAGL